MKGMRYANRPTALDSPAATRRHYLACDVINESLNPVSQRLSAGLGHATLCELTTDDVIVEPTTTAIRYSLAAPPLDPPCISRFASALVRIAK